MSPVATIDLRWEDRTFVATEIKVTNAYVRARGQFRRPLTWRIAEDDEPEYYWWPEAEYTWPWRMIRRVVHLDDEATA